MKQVHVSDMVSPLALVPCGTAVPVKHCVPFGCTLNSTIQGCCHTSGHKHTAAVLRSVSVIPITRRQHHFSLVLAVVYFSFDLNSECNLDDSPLHAIESARELGMALRLRGTSLDMKIKHANLNILTVQ
jgi:hypothetical protein